MYRHRDLSKRSADLIMSLLAEHAGESKDYFDRMFAGCTMDTFRWAFFEF